jgi:hypothetical protein
MLQAHRDFVSDLSDVAPEEVDYTGDPRIQTKAYHRWLSLIGEGQSYPSVENLDLQDEEFGPWGFLIDLTTDHENAEISFVGRALRERDGLSDDLSLVRDIPPRSILSRLSAHYLQAVANEAPIGFSAEFQGPEGNAIPYRGILLPFSSTGDTIDFVYGVLSWKHISNTEVEPGRAAPKKSDGPKQMALNRPSLADQSSTVATTSLLSRLVHDECNSGGSEQLGSALPQDTTLTAAFAEISRLNDLLAQTRQELAVAEAEAAKTRFIIASMKELCQLR